MTNLPTHELYRLACEAVQRANFPPFKEPTFLEGYFNRYYTALLDLGFHLLDEGVNTELARVVDNLYEAEQLDHVPEPSALAGTIDEGRYRDKLLLIIKRASDPTATLDIFYDAVVEIAVNFTRHLQNYAIEPPPFGSYIGEVIDLIPDPHAAILEMYLPLFKKEACELGLFASQRAQILSNEHDVVDRNPKLKKVRLPTPALHGAEPKESVRLFLRGTCLQPIFFHDVVFEGPEFAIPEEARTEHTFVLGPPGSGKTTLLEKMICDDLAKDDPPAMVIIDPKGLMVERISKLDVFNPETGPLKDRLVIINPLADLPPALNLFDSTSLMNRMWSKQVQSRIADQTASTFSYIFSSSNYALTPKMGTPFSYAVQLLFKMPGATIEDMFDLLNDKQLAGSRFSPFIDLLDSTAQRFFKNDFYGSTEYADTKRQIKGRIYDVLKSAPIQAMLYSKTKKIDLPRWIAEKKIVLVNTCMAQLQEAHQLLGRYIISATFIAALSRVAIPNKQQWHPAYLYIDEFGEFADKIQIPRMLRLMREYKVGAVLAHQSLHDETIDDSLRATISTATSIKYASSPEGIDLNYAARDLRCEPDWLRQQTKTATHARFGCFVRGHLEHPISVTMPFGMIGKLPQMSDEAHERLIEVKQREVASLPTDQVPPRQPEPVSLKNRFAPDIRQPRSTAGPEQQQSSAPDTPEAGSTW
jgi:hypothetical protein